jgi:hypothetical protein
MREHVKGLRVPKKTRHADEQLFEQEVEFIGLLL